MITFFSILLLSICLLLTLSYLKKWFKPIEILLLFMFTSYFCQNMFYTISSPYKRLAVVTEHFPFWTVRLQYGIVFAVTLLWVLAAYRSQLSFNKKLAITFSWILFGVLMEKIFLLCGVLESKTKSWYPSLDMFFEMLVILIAVYFMNLLHHILKREQVI
ncbi:hypothetical protein LCL95_06980 [Bacillus timonensis]|nr:hypothetical protein [Bacillus timonensis]